MVLMKGPARRDDRPTVLTLAPGIFFFFLLFFSSRLFFLRLVLLFSYSLSTIGFVWVKKHCQSF